MDIYDKYHFIGSCALFEIERRMHLRGRLCGTPGRGEVRAYRDAELATQEKGRPQRAALDILEMPVHRIGSRILCAQVSVSIDHLVLDDAHRLVDGHLVWVIHVHMIGREFVHNLDRVVQSQ